MEVDVMPVDVIIALEGVAVDHVNGHGHGSDGVVFQDKAKIRAKR